MRLPVPPPPWYLRPLHWRQRRKYGVLLDPTALWSYRPRALLAFLGLVAALRGRRSPLPAGLRALVALRVSQLNSCAFCVDMNASMLDDASMAQDKVAAVADWRDRPEFAPTERLALEYAEAMTSTPPAVSDDLFQRLRTILPPAAIVELTAVVALQNMSARFNSALQADAYGFCRFADGPTGKPGADVSNSDGPR